MTVQELIDTLQKIEDKAQKIHCWDHYGYWGEVAYIEIEESQTAKPLMIESSWK